MGRQDGEEGRGHTGHLLDKAGRLRAAFAVGSRVIPIGVEEERLPAVRAAGQPGLIDRYVVKVRQVSVMGEQPVQLPPHDLPPRFEPRDPGEVLGPEEGLDRHKGRAGDQRLEDLQQSKAGPEEGGPESPGCGPPGRPGTSPAFVNTQASHGRQQASNTRARGRQLTPLVVGRFGVVSDPFRAMVPGVEADQLAMVGLAFELGPDPVGMPAAA